jgi:hypothetical protein
MVTTLTAPPAHRSYSQYRTYSHCGEQFRLERITKFPQKPAWWFVGGTSFHTATEYLDRGETDDPDVAWTRAWNDELARVQDSTDVPQGEWRKGGRKTKDKPNGEDGPFWMEYGKQLTADYWMWRSNNFGWQLYEMPYVVDGVAKDLPAIEWGGTVWFGQTPIKAYIDRLFVNPNGEIVVVDLKTGSKEPDPQQLALYATVVELATGSRPPLGAYYMARKGTITVPADLDQWGLDYWTPLFTQVEAGINAGVFLPNVGMLCNSCGVKDGCVAFGGKVT